MEARIEFRILGSLEVVEGGRDIPIERGRQRALLGCLLLRANEVVGRDRLIDALWGESPPATAVTALQGHVSRLRRLLGEGRIETRNRGYRLQVAPGELDVQVFRDLLAGGRYAEALAVWRGPVLDEVELDDIAETEIARLKEQRVAALEEHFDRELSVGMHATLTAELSAAVRAHPLRERLVGQLMTALYRSGRQADALTVCRRTRELLSRELGVAPSEELGRLEHRILAHNRALDLVRGGRRSELPAAVTSFVGRRRELEQVRSLIKRPGMRLLTLTGTGGTGKTRLALEAARAAAPDFADGACFVPLATLTQSGLMPYAIAHALSIDQSHGQQIEDALRAYFADREMLLVLDNLEHLLDAAPLATDLLGVAPRLTVVTTSRVHLNLYGETEYAVPPLSARDEAVVLFTERAEAVRPDFVATHLVADICARVDGLPLAVELAAAQVRTLAVPDILAGLDRRLELLAGGPRDVHARQRTLRNAIQWSYDLLTPAEQVLFARLAVFAGHWSEAAAADVCGHDLGPNTSVLAHSLAEKNLVLREAHERFAMLATIREFAAERLAAGDEGTTTRDRHLRWCLAIAEEGGPERRGRDRLAWLDRISREQENLRTALQWALARGDDESGRRLAVGLVPFWIARGMLDEAIRCLAEVVSAPARPSDARGRPLAAAGLLWMLNGEVEKAEAACRESLALLPGGDDWYRAIALNVLGTAARYREEWGQARHLYRQALALTTASDLWWPAALVQANLGELETLARRHGEALERHLTAVAIARKGTDTWMVAICLANAGRAARRLGELDRSAALFTQALRDFVSLHNAWGIAVCMDAFASLAADGGDHVRAARLFGAGETIREQGRLAVWPTIRAERASGMIATQAALGQPGWAREHALGRARTIDEAIAEACAQVTLASGDRS